MIWEVDDGTREIEGLDEDGRPDPEYAQRLGLTRARFGMRALAAVIEHVIFIAILVPFGIWVAPTLVRVAMGELDGYGLVQHPNFVFMLVVAIATVVLLLVFALVQGLLHGKKGVTIGKAFCGIRSVNVKTLERPGFWRITLRAVIYIASWVLPVIGPALFLVSPLFDSERRGRGWLDLAASTWFVDIRDGLNPYDRKRMRIARKSVQVAPNAERAALPALSTEAETEEEGRLYRARGRVSAGVIGSRRPQSSVAANPESGSTDAPAPKRAERIGPKGEPAPARRTIVTAAPSAGRISAKEEVDYSAVIEETVVHADAAPVTMGAVIVLDDGTRHEIVATALLGRNPAGEGTLIRVVDTTRSVSKTHLRVEPEVGGVRVADLQSKNGVRLRSGGTWTRIDPDGAVFVAIGDAVGFGDRVMQIEELR